MTIEKILATPAAVSRLQIMLEKRGKGAGVRFGVKNSGCSGKKYILDLVDDFDSQDLIFDTGVKIAVDPESYVYVAGTTIDYVKKGLNTQFVFHNPQEKASCGCGESFHV